MNAPKALPPRVAIPNVDTNIDVMVTTLPRKAGVETVTLTNSWLDCRFTVAPAVEPIRGHQRGFRWRAYFHTKDTNETSTFTGLAETRQVAHYAAIQALKRNIDENRNERLRYIDRNYRARQASAAVGLTDGIVEDA